MSFSQLSKGFSGLLGTIKLGIYYFKFSFKKKPLRFFFFKEIMFQLLHMFPSNFPLPQKQVMP